MDYKEVDLATINQGAANELFKAGMKDVLYNIGDPNTDPKAKRVVTIEIALKPSETRDVAQTSIQMKTRLAPVRQHESFVQLITDGMNTKAYGTDVKQQDLVPAGEEE
jgi:hypothetical protein